MCQQEHELWMAMTSRFMKQWGDQKDISRECAIFVGEMMDMSNGGGSKCIFWYNSAGSSKSCSNGFFCRQYGNI